MKATERDYSDLEGKKVNFICPDKSGGRVKVHLVEYDLGITLVKAEDENEYVLCLRNCKNLKMSASDQHLYPAFFFTLVRMIKKGVVNISMNSPYTMINNLDSEPDHFRERPGYDTCALQAGMR